MRIQILILGFKGLSKMTVPSPLGNVKIVLSISAKYIDTQLTAYKAVNC